MDQLNRIISIILPLLPIFIAGLLALMCLIVLVLIVKKFIETWRLFYSKQRLFNKLFGALVDTDGAEAVEGDEDIISEETVPADESTVNVKVEDEKQSDGK